MKLYIDIWLQPIKTITEFVSEGNKKDVPVIPYLIFGANLGLDMVPGIMDNTNLNNHYSIIPFTIPISILLILVVFRFTIPFMIRTVGLLWKGVASNKQLAKACSISLIPYTLIALAQIILLLIEVEISSDVFDFSARSIILCWSFILLVIGVAKAQHFSYGFALLNIILSYLPFLLLSLLRS